MAFRPVLDRIHHQQYSSICGSSTKVEYAILGSSRSCDIRFDRRFVHLYGKCLLILVCKLRFIVT